MRTALAVLALATLLSGLGGSPPTASAEDDGGWRPPPIAVGRPLPQAFVDGRRFATWPEVRSAFLRVHGEDDTKWPAPVRAFVRRQRHKLTRDLALEFSYHYFSQRPWPDVYRRYRSIHRPGNEDAMDAFFSQVELPTEKARALYAQRHRADPVEWLRPYPSNADKKQYGARIPLCRIDEFVTHVMGSRYWIARLDVFFSTYSGRPEHNELVYARDELAKELFLKLWKARRIALASWCSEMFSTKLHDPVIRPHKEQLDNELRNELEAPLRATATVAYSYDHCTANWYLAPASPPATVNGEPRDKGCSFDIIESWRYRYPTLTWATSTPERPRRETEYELGMSPGLRMKGWGATKPEEPEPWAVHELQGPAIYVLVINRGGDACPEKGLRPAVPCEVPATLLVHPDGRPDYCYQVGLPQIPRQAGAGAEEGVLAYSWSGPASIAKRIGDMWLEACLAGLRNWVDKVGEPFDEDGAWSSPDLSLTCSPGEVAADGKSQVGVSIKAYVTEHGRLGTRRRPIQGATVSLRSGASTAGGAPLGTLSTTSVTTDASGRATATYTVPSAEELAGYPYDWVTIRARCTVEGQDLEELATIYFETDQGEVFVEPHSGKTTFSNKGLIPADPRFPAWIGFNLKDDRGWEVPNKPVTFRLTSPTPVGELRTLDGAKRGPALEVVTDKDGQAEVLYVYTGAGALEAPLLEEITIAGKDGGQPKKAYVSVGMDLVAEAVTSAFEGSREIAAGSEIPLSITARDRFHPGAHDLGRVLDYWGGGGARGNVRLWAWLDVEPATQVPDYMMDALRLEVHPSPPFAARMRLKRHKSTGKGMLWASAASGLLYEGWPRVRPPVSGRHLYRVSVGLADDSGKALSGQLDPRPVQYVTIPTGLPADAMTIFLYEDPFKAHTPQQKFLRAIVEKAGFGEILAFTEYATMLNKGDIEGMVRKAVEDRLGWLEGKAGGVAQLEGVVDVLGAASYAEQCTTTALKYAPKQSAHGPPIQGLKKRIIDGVMRKLNLKGKRIVIVTGDGSQGVEDAKSGKRLPAEDGKWRARGDAKSYSVKNGPVSVYVVDKAIKLRPTSGAEVEEYGR